MTAEFKPVFNPQRVPLHEVLPLDTPFCVGITPTTLCDLHCKYCIHSLPKDELTKKGFNLHTLDFDMLEHILNELKKFPKKIKSLTFGGQGEPLVNPNFPQMAKLIREADICESLSFITNAVKLTPEKSKAIIDAGVDRIYISLQGMSAEKYLEVCGKKIDFDEYIENIRYFYEYSRGKCKVNVKIADVALDEGDLEKFKQVCGQIADVIHVETIKPLYADVDYTEILGGKLEAEATTISRFGRQHKFQKACYLSFYMMCIDPDGTIKPCGAPFCAVNLGNVKDTSLVDAWNSNARRNFLIEMLEGKRNENQVCRGCDYPNDVPYESDEIDPWADKLLERYKQEA